MGSHELWLGLWEHLYTGHLMMVHNDFPLRLPFCASCTSDKKSFTKIESDDKDKEPGKRGGVKSQEFPKLAF